MDSFRRTGGIVLAVAMLAGCSGRSALVPAQPAQPALGAAAIEGSHAPITPDACSNPQKLKICLKPGGSYKLKLTLTCYIGTQHASCGTVTWKTKMSNKLLTGKFKPNPANPTTETVTAAKSIKTGHYTQSINASCTGVPNCNYTSKGMIWVT